jgi:DNA repair protein RecN (Recombination protein N)
LNQVEERLNLIHNLKRKYGTDIPAVLAFAEKARSELAAVANSAERISELESEEIELLKKLVGDRERLLSAKRHSAAQMLETCRRI